MLSFVVQNFSHQSPFIINTVSYHVVVKALSTSILSLFSYVTVYYYLTASYSPFTQHRISLFLDAQFLQSFWASFNSFIIRKRGIYSGNLIHSLSGYALSKLTLGSEFSSTPQMLTEGTNSLYYLRPVQVFTMSFHNNIYNSFMWYIFNVLLFTYFKPLPTYRLNYSFLFFNQNMWLLNFINVFYLNVRNF